MNAGVWRRSAARNPPGAATPNPAYLCPPPPPTPPARA